LDIVVYKNLQGKLAENGLSFTKTLPNGQKATAIADPASAFTVTNDEESSLNSYKPIRSLALLNLNRNESPKPDKDMSGKVGIRLPT
jgi:hypothetical protein